ncbi:MAG: hypothetical protein Q7S40_03510 [Opitutaceae bacterium]|nr:hypothetical protein [Opitutaceae bacterium]
MSQFYNDGTFVNYGTQLLPISGLAGTLLGTYVAENWSATYPSDKIQIRNQQNGPAGQIFISGFSNGSATLQCGQTGTPVPHNGAKYGLYGSVWVISEIGRTETQGDIVKANVNFDRLIN